MVISNRIGHAMSQQLDRVNNSQERLQERIDELERTNARLREQLRKAHDRIEVYELDTPYYPVGLTYSGRPTLTAAEAATAAGVSRATVTRYVQSGYWQGDRIGGRLMIYGDQPLTAKRKTARR
jgi:Fic family protein